MKGARLLGSPVIVPPAFLSAIIGPSMNRKPNILVFMTDHQRGDTVLPGGPARMPNVEKLRKGAVAFSETFCPSPHCCPARATLMTGLYPAQHGIWHNVDVANAITRGLSDGVRTWGEDFRDAGYRMWYSGKWHISHYESPADRGWNVCPGTEGDYSKRTVYKSDMWETYRELAGHPEPEKRGEGEILTPGYGPFTLYGAGEGNKTDIRHVDEGVRKLESLLAEKTDRPWCLFTSCNGPHDPYYVPREFLDMYDANDIRLPANFADDMRDKPNFYRRTKDRFDQLTEREHREGIRHYLAYCTFEDHLFGKLLEVLDRSGQAENTVVIYLSDHGDYMAEHGLWAKGLPCFRGAYHVPLMVRWPKAMEKPGRLVDRLVSLADLAPTLLELAGIDAGREFTGRSLAPFLRGETPEDWRDMLFTQTNGNELYGIQRAAFNKDWKMVYNGFDYDELYDLRRDPCEMRNLVREPGNSGVIRDMMRRIWRFSYQTGDTCINPYIMVRFAEYGPAEAFRE